MPAPSTRVTFSTLGIGPFLTSCPADDEMRTPPRLVGERLAGLFEGVLDAGEGGGEGLAGPERRPARPR